VDHLHEGGAPVDAALETQAKSAGDEYVDTYTFTIGHDMCQPDAAKRWIEPLDTKLKPAHPNSTGQVAMYWELYPKLVSQS
jgi:hypothetical protein